MRKLCFLLILTFFTVNAQDNIDYSQEVLDIQNRIKQSWNPEKNCIVFTGSSSVRLWEDLEERFPNVQILNTGFGGSQSYDLLGFIDELILDFSPKKVFIYEGDNDLAAKKKPREVLNTLEDIVDKIHAKLPYTEVYLISAKPSISRWKLRIKYRRLNTAMKLFSQQVSHVTYVDVWEVMLNGRRLNEGLFIEDGLHMTSEGYDLWQKELQPHVK